MGRLEEPVGDTGLQGLVVGRWGEASQDLHNLIQGLAEARGLHEARTPGTLSTIVSLYRRILSCVFLQANESCLVSRKGHLDEGKRGAASRRRAVVRTEELDRAEASAHFQAYISGRGGARRGRLTQ